MFANKNILEAIHTLAPIILYCCFIIHCHTIVSPLDIMTALINMFIEDSMQSSMRRTEQKQ